MSFKLAYFIKEALGSFRKNWVMSFAAITTVAVSLLVFGVFSIGSLLASSLIKQAQKEVGLIEVFLRDSASVQKVNVLQDKILSWDEVATVNYVSKDEALKRMKQMFKDKPEMIEAMSGNPLPASLEVRVRDSKDARQLVSRIEGETEAVQDIRYAEDIIDKVFIIAKTSRLVAIVFIGLLVFAALVLIVNTIRLAIFARRREIAIMKLVGASNWFIRWPFLLEGIIQGAIGAAMAMLAVYVFHQSLVTQVSRSLGFLNLSFDESVLLRLLLVLLIAGVVVGASGSGIALRRFLKV